MILSPSPLPSLQKSQGILLLDKPQGKTSFYLVAVLRKITQIRKIGHAGTLDPLATGLMVMLIGQNYTRKTPEIIGHDKEYETTILLGKATDSYDLDGKVTMTSDYIPSYEEITSCLVSFQGLILQTPPMFSAKKQNGKKLYELARLGKEVERKQIAVTVKTTLLSYTYPYLQLRISCSSGTYIRTLADDLGKMLNCFGSVAALKRIRSGPFHLDDAISLETLHQSNYQEFLIEGI